MIFQFMITYLVFDIDTLFKPTKMCVVSGHRFFCQPVRYVIHVYAVIGTRPDLPHTKYDG